MLGEIDCREGLLLAVDKLKYDTMEQAMAVLIGLYVRVLLGLIAQRRFEVFVHPVPPVLDETRHVVQPFNRALQREVGLGFRVQVSCQLWTKVLACGAAVQPRIAERGGSTDYRKPPAMCIQSPASEAGLGPLPLLGKASPGGAASPYRCSAAFLAHFPCVACAYHPVFLQVLRQNPYVYERVLQHPCW